MSSKLMTRRRKSVGIAAVAAVGAGLFLTAGTGCEAMVEEWNDAPVIKKYDHGAEVYSMPDGFANFASKCDVHGNRVFTEKIDTGRAIAVVPNDPSCDPWKK